MSRVTDKKAELIFFKKFSKYLERNGFTPDKGSNTTGRRTTQYGFAVIGNSFTTFAKLLHASCNYVLRLDEVEKVVEEYVREIEGRDIYDGKLVTVQIPAYLFAKHYRGKREVDAAQYIVEPATEEGVKEYYYFFEDIMSTYVIPYGNELADIKNLEGHIRRATDNYENLTRQPVSGVLFTSFLNSINYHFRIMVIAKLAGVTDLEKIYALLHKEMLQHVHIDERFAKAPLCLEKLYRRLIAG
jgi:hypothetical protein